MSRKNVLPSFRIAFGGLTRFPLVDYEDYYSWEPISDNEESYREVQTPVQASEPVADLAEQVSVPAQGCLPVEANQPIQDSHERQYPDNGKEKETIKCTICHKTFKYNTSLNRHLFRVHSIGGPVACNQCDRSFKNRHGLLRHIIHSHSGPNNSVMTATNNSVMTAKQMNSHKGV